MGFIGLGMKNFVSIFIWTFLFVSTQLFGAIIHVPNLDVIEKCISDLDEDALVVFDVVNTLLVSNDRILAPCGDAYFQKFMKNFGQEERIALRSRILLQSKVSLVDEKILKFLNQLKQNNIKVIALSAMPTGQYGLILNAEQWRVKQLASLGIYLDWSFPEIDSLILDNDPHEKKAVPIFKRGVLATGDYQKGKVLCAFLKKMRWKPSKVIFIDDKMEYIDSVEYELDKENIEHISFHYTAATDRSCHLDQRLADFQFDYLMHHGDWLSDQEAKNKMNMSENPQKMDAMLQKNRKKFAAVKKLELPIGQYAITGSGALGIRNLRKIGDVDIIVTAELWNVLAAKYGVTDETGVKKIVFPNGIVEALGGCSFYTEKKDPDAPTIADRITHAEIIEGLPFESLEHVLYYKRKMGREKDVRDVLIIEEWQKSKRVNTR